MWGRYFSADVLVTKPLRMPRYECIGDESADTYPAILRALKYRAVEKHLRDLED